MFWGKLGRVGRRYDRVQDRSVSSAGVLGTTFSCALGFVGFLWLIYISFKVPKLNKRYDGLDKNLSEVKALLVLFQQLAEKGNPDGYAPLDDNGTIPEEHLPDEFINAALFRGCWNASINFPFIISGAGVDGEFFIVCAPGSTPIDGEMEWNLHDLVFFDAVAELWRRIDGGRNTIVDAVAPASGSEISVIADGTGPFFSLLKIEGSTGGAVKGVNVSSDGETVLFESGADANLNDAGAFESFVLNGSGPVLEIRQMDSEELLCGQCSRIHITPNPFYLRLWLPIFYRSGTWPAQAWVKGVIESPLTRGEGCGIGYQNGRFMRIGEFVTAAIKHTIILDAGVTETRFVWNAPVNSLFPGHTGTTNAIVTEVIGMPSNANLNCGTPFGQDTDFNFHMTGVIVFTGGNAYNLKLDVDPPTVVPTRFVFHVYASWRDTIPP